ncbi:MAG: glycerophosphodiester phosphodiesterase family protein [Spirochaetia bacterium]|nr:glycerophosphodiester phosphodiesterase family protein [Spirochaetia bacterium]
MEWIFLFLIIVFFLFLIFLDINHKPKKFNELIDSFENQLKVASHRGYGKRGSIAENTMPAFEKSTKEGIGIHELDVRISKDGVVIIFHGPDLSSTTNGRGKVEKKTIEELNKLNWGFYLRDSNLAKEKKYSILTLDHYLSSLGQKVITNIELKKEWFVFSSKLEQITIETVKKNNAQRRVFFSSFNLFVLRNLKKKAPEFGIGLLLEPGFFFSIRSFLFRVILRPDFIHLPKEHAGNKRIQKYKKKGYGIVVWTVNDKQKIKELLSFGADIVITDNISAALTFKKNLI